MPEPFTLYKLMVLYMLDNVDFPLTNAQISEFILDRGYTSYLTLQTVFAELVESEMIRQEIIRNCSYYSITETGEETLGYFKNRIVYTIREDIMAWLKENRIKLKDEVSVLSDYYKTSNGEYYVRCLVKEKYANPIDLTITVPDEMHAKRVCRHWREKCQKIYEDVMKELL